MKPFNHLIPLLLVLFLASCGEAFLDVKPSRNQRVPNTVADYLALLDNPTANNNPMNIRSSHTLGIIGADEFYISTEHWNNFSSGVRFNYQKNAYTWEKTVYEGGEGGTLNPTDFDTGYQRILNCNIVLDGLANMSSQHQQDDWRLTRGIALFHRALNLYNLAQLFCPVYNEDTAPVDLGLPLRLEADPTVQLARSSVSDTYQQIVNDLMEAVQLLPDEPLVPFRPSKAAAYALLARAYLQMGNYPKALEYANRCLAVQSALLDFNDLEIGANYPFPLYGIGNVEVIFTSSAYNALIYGSARFNADTSLLASYSPEDLRRAIYFRISSNGQSQFFGSYYGNDFFFTGLATDEVYLIRAECHAREGNTVEALNDLNHLRRHRLEATGYTPLESADSQQILDWVISERRKELVLRGTRWEDLRRLNKDPRYEKPLVRVLGEQHFELPVNHDRWVWPFPVEAIQAGGYPQNDR
ncbi:RagB/SusD family nutrient uptake outer membrane protein [Parapedobacter tibetensis]|uniref:RagB/SusD family nutrient uptake outer membrane protein n=1 Tax=Parapedobacter tibetensis TaxID=2972951 RepID=UPI00214D16FF|nr:RagB/SusD family nutrient uptake outer membrane protein [Parapedobacter tibetensis]